MLAAGGGAKPDFVKSWQPVPTAQMLVELPPLREVVPGFVRPGLITVFGAPGSLKSLLLADLCVCAALGRPWLEPLPTESVQAKPTQQTAVVWLDTDNGRRTTCARFGALLRAYGVTDPNASVPLYPFALPSPAFVAGDDGAAAAMRDLVQHYKAGLLVIDNLGNVLGDADENSAEMAVVMGNLRRLAEDADCCVVLIHHQRKANGTKARAGETLRGHSSIEAALDLALMVERDETQRDLVTLRPTKCRHADVAPFGARFTHEHKPGTKDLKRARFFGCEPELDHAEQDSQRLDKAILDAAEGLSQARLVQRVQAVLPTVGKHRVRQRVEALVQEGRLRVEHGGRRAFVYYSV